MDNFHCIYKILRTLEKAMDYQEYDFECISPTALGVSEERWKRYIIMLSDNGYVEDVFIKKYTDGETVIRIENMKITLKGLEYLSENSIMQRIYQAAKGIKDILPGV